MNPSQAVDILLETGLPCVGDRVKLTTGAEVEIVDIGPFSELKQKYPDAAARALENSTRPESSFKTAWVMKDGTGTTWMAGSQAMKLFVVGR